MRIPKNTQLNVWIIDPNITVGSSIKVDGVTVTVNHYTPDQITPAEVRGKVSVSVLFCNTSQQEFATNYPDLFTALQSSLMATHGQFLEEHSN